MNVISDKIAYLPAVDDPLSADVYFIKGKANCYIYDVGNNEDSLHHINCIKQPKIVILSHCHKDHIGNIEHSDYQDLYVGKETHDIVGKGKIVTETVTIDDGVKIEIIPCPSPHTEGSLIINIDNQYTLIADLYFTRPPFNREKIRKMLDILQQIDTQYFVVSHQENEKIIPKDRLISELLNYFNQ